MPKDRRNPRHRAIGIAAVAALLVVASLTYVAIQLHGKGASQRNPHGPLLQKLAELESALEKGISAPKMQQMAAEIETELRLHPLPDDDDLQFSGDLIVRYLRELAVLENFRAQKLAKGEKDPLDPRGENPNTEAIAAHQKYSAWLRQRTKEFRTTLSTQVPGRSERTTQ